MSKTNRGPRVTMGNIVWGPKRYPTLRVRDGGERYYFSLHRLTAFAHGIIDSPRFEDPIWIIDGQNGGEVRTEVDHREVHHQDEDKMNGSPDNLEAMEPRDHTIHHNGNN